jgi:hypothetical protein
MNGDNVNNPRCETARTFMKNREYLKDQINESEINSMNKNIRNMSRDINEYEKCYQPRTQLAKAESGDLLGNPHSILNRWKNYFCQLFNVHGINYVRQT